MKRIVFAVLFMVVNGALAQSDDPSLGIWKMNREKSKFNSVSMPYTLTLTVEIVGKGVRSTAEGLSAGGRPFKIQFTAYYDGQDWPVTGSSVRNTASFRRIDARTTERVDKLNGRVVQTVVWVVSEDGRSLTSKSSPSEDTIIYDKQ
jgi:hypothetical protein